MVRERMRNSVNWDSEGDHASQERDADSVSPEVGAVPSQMQGPTTTSASTGGAIKWLREALFQALKAIYGKQAGGGNPVPELILIHSRFRPFEREERERSGRNGCRRWIRHRLRPGALWWPRRPLRPEWTFPLVC